VRLVDGRAELRLRCGDSTGRRRKRLLDTKPKPRPPGATNAEAITAAVGGLGLHGELLTLAALADPVQVSPTQLITISGTVHGHPAGASNDLEDTLNFAALHGIKTMVEVMPLANAADGYQRMMASQARFRVVLITENAGA
jgi:alcohol dehydrogenase